jgi:hypothetical protein
MHLFYLIFLFGAMVWFILDGINESQKKTWMRKEKAVVLPSDCELKSDTRKDDVY